MIKNLAQKSLLLILFSSTQSMQSMLKPESNEITKKVFDSSIQYYGKLAPSTSKVYIVFYNTETQEYRARFYTSEGEVKYETKSAQELFKKLAAKFVQQQSPPLQFKRSIN